MRTIAAKEFEAIRVGIAQQRMPGKPIIDSYSKLRIFR